ncbi:MAG: hypothetical protein ACP5ID_00970 [Conexivisphaera sp.]
MIHAVENNALDPLKIVGELAEVVRSGGLKRTSGEISVFKSVGIGYLDVIASALAYRNAGAQGLGSRARI